MASSPSMLTTNSACAFSGVFPLVFIVTDELRIRSASSSDRASSPESRAAIELGLAWSVKTISSPSISDRFSMAAVRESFPPTSSPPHAEARRSNDAPSEMSFFMGPPLGQVCDSGIQVLADARVEGNLDLGESSGLGTSEMADELDDPVDGVGLEAQYPLVVAQAKRAR